MPLSNSVVAEEALALDAPDRAQLAKLLIDSLAGDERSDREIAAELNQRLELLVSGKDNGLTFAEVFGTDL
jgi:putative addiction module component (TIGR02574 family)